MTDVQVSLHKKLEKKFNGLKKTAVTYKQAKINLKTSLEKQETPRENSSEPEMAVDVLEQESAEEKPIEQALIFEHIFRKAIEASIPSGIVGFDMEFKEFDNRLMVWLLRRRKERDNDEPPADSCAVQILPRFAR